MKKRNYTIIKSLTCLVLITSFNILTIVEKSFAGNLPPGFDTIAPSISLIGSSDTTLGVYTTFNDPGVTVHDDYTSDSSITINKAGFVETTKLGDYQINYSAIDSAGNNSDTVTRIVHVVDTIAPSISLKGGALNLCVPDTLLADLGFGLYDNYWYENNIDVEIFGSYYDDYLVNFKVGTYIISYCATDGSGNSDTAHRNVHVYDTSIAPIITLKGYSIMTIELHNPFNDPGVTVYYPNRPENHMTVYINGQVDTGKLGTYILSYTATEPCGGISDTVSRTVHVKEGTGIIKPEHRNFFNLYPNPNNGKFNVHLDRHSISRIEIRDIYGRLVYSSIPRKTELMEIHLEEHSGIYFLSVFSNKNKTTFKLIKE